jgi:hypothetical protein
MTCGRPSPVPCRTASSRVIPNVHPPVSFRTSILPCHSERPSSRVIPNVVRNLQSGIRRETVQNSRRFLVATLLGMTGGAPRNDRGGRSERPFSRCHSERSEESAVGNTAGDGAKLEEIPRRCAPRNDRGRRSERPSSRVIPNVVRNLQSGIRRETVQNSRRFLVAALLGMTEGGSSE